MRECSLSSNSKKGHSRQLEQSRSGIMTMYRHRVSLIIFNESSKEGDKVNE